MTKLYFFIALLAFTQVAFGKDDFLEKGNELLNEGNYTEAEKLFRDAIHADHYNVDYKCQLAFCLMNEKKFTAAAGVIDKILTTNPDNAAALWYGGMNNYLNKKGDPQLSIYYFEKALTHLDKKEEHYYTAHLLIGKSYQVELQKTGLKYKEIVRMLECYKIYVNIQPDTPEAAKIEEYIKHIEETWPQNKLKKWIDKDAINSMIS